eukprot:TRINITY_DN10498_c0_g1_i1.p1 TRINITY_DN10498_c0_g1~~TRINITY_DN10498_c0_g1_i1.p1  ORF type:complete len:465 (-),score=44.05 TRINITY_DN10498_c0_g1_i1:80-1474(-)
MFTFRTIDILLGYSILCVASNAKREHALAANHAPEPSFPSGYVRTTSHNSTLSRVTSSSMSSISARTGMSAVSYHPWCWGAKILKELDWGDYGTVTLLRFPRRMLFAMKKQIGDRNMFEREYVLQELAAKTCPLSIAVIFTAWEDWTNYALLEAGLGGDLRQWMISNFNSGGLAFVDDGRLAQLIFAQVVLAVKRIHDAGITHANLKPENIIVMSETCKKLHAAKCSSVTSDCTFSQRWIDNKCAVKISNYGMSCVDREASGSLPEMHGCSSHSDLSPAYSAPELFYGAEEHVPSPKSPKRSAMDIWALGCILHFILYGTHLFFDDADHHLRRTHILMVPFFINCAWPEAPKLKKIRKVCKNVIWRDGFLGSRAIAEDVWNLPYVEEVHTETLSVEEHEASSVGHGENYVPPEIVTGAVKSSLNSSHELPGLYATFRNPFPDAREAMNAVTSLFDLEEWDSLVS